MKKENDSQKIFTSKDSVDNETTKNPLPENYASDFPYSDAKEYEKLANEALKLIRPFMDKIQSCRDDLIYDIELFIIDFTKEIDVHDFSSFVHYFNKMSESESRDKIWDNLSKHDKVLQYIKTNTIKRIDEVQTNLSEDKSLFNKLIAQINALKPPLVEDNDSDFDKKEFEEIADATSGIIIEFMDNIVDLGSMSFISENIYVDAKHSTDSDVCRFEDYLKYCEEMMESDANNGIWGNLSKFEKVFQFTKKITIEKICFTMDAIAEEMSHLNSLKDQLHAFISSKDPGNNEETTQNSLHENCDSGNSFNDDGMDKCQDMIDAAVEMKLSTWSDFIKPIDGYNEYIIGLFETIRRKLRQVCTYDLYQHWNCQHEDRSDLLLQEKVVQFVQEASDAVICGASEDTNFTMNIFKLFNTRKSQE